MIIAAVEILGFGGHVHIGEALRVQQFGCPQYLQGGFGAVAVPAERADRVGIQAVVLHGFDALPSRVLFDAGDGLRGVAPAYDDDVGVGADDGFHRHFAQVGLFGQRGAAAGNAYPFADHRAAAVDAAQVGAAGEVQHAGFLRVAQVGQPAAYETQVAV